MTLADLEGDDNNRNSSDSDNKPVCIHKQSWKEQPKEKKSKQVSTNPSDKMGYKAGFNSKDAIYAGFGDGLRLKKYNERDFERELEDQKMEDRRKAGK